MAYSTSADQKYISLLRQHVLVYIEYMLTQEWYMFYVMTTSSRYASEGGVSLSLVPRPSRGGEKKAWCTLFVHAC